MKTLAQYSQEKELANYAHSAISTLQSDTLCRYTIYYDAITLSVSFLSPKSHSPIYHFLLHIPVTLWVACSYNTEVHDVCSNSITKGSIFMMFVATA